MGRAAFRSKIYILTLQKLIYFFLFDLHFSTTSDPYATYPKNKIAQINKPFIEREMIVTYTTNKSRMYNIVLQVRI